METKLFLRKLMKEKLSLMSPEEKVLKSKLLSKHLDSLLNELQVIQKNLFVGVYAPIEREPVWSLELQDLFHGHTAYPSFGSAELGMVFKKAKKSELVEREDFGVKMLGPDENTQNVVPEIILVPGLAFSLKGERLGRGKGFYDRYFKKNDRGIKIGICFSSQLLDKLPTEEHDKKVNYIVTEDRIINIGS